MLRNILRTSWRILRTGLLVFVLALLVQKSAVPPADLTERVRYYTRGLEFDYVEWTINAFRIKFSQSALGVNRYLSDETGAAVVLDFIDMTRRIQQAESEMRRILADPAIEDKESATRELHDQLAEDYRLRKRLGPLAESILQSQVVSVLREQGITTGGQPIPPVLYHMTPAPMALIVSPREVIQQDSNISIQPEMTVEEQVELEEVVAEGLDVSTLVVPIGGIGLYPTMVTQTSNINWLAEVVSHEWSHNYFSLHPLGVSYLASPELRTMNETAASIFGNEIGARLIERFYPAFVPPPPEPPTDETPEEPFEEPAAPVFDPRSELRETRLKAEELLARGEVEKAEIYMELRRRFLWDNGYRIRKLNQAYFAFYGAYADRPGGAAGDDPVAAAVRQLREESPTLLDFMTTMAWLSSYEDLAVRVSQDPGG